MKTKLHEALPPLIPEYPIEVAGHHLTLRFDVNINKTKKGVKLQFIMNDIPSDPRQVQSMANEIGTQLQEKFAESGLQIIQDLENPYKNVIGFLLPLPSLATFLIKNVLKNEVSPQEPSTGKEPQEPVNPQDSLPDTEQPPAGETVREIFMRRAGLR